MKNTTRDANHWWRYLFVKTRRYYRQNAKNHLVSFYNSMVDCINALARSLLGIVIVFSSLTADLCKKEQQRWYRKSLEEK